MSTYKLIVVSAFGKYRKGDRITDQKIISQILDKNNSMSDNKRNCRLVFLKDVEKQNEENQKIEVEKKESPLEEEKSILLKSIKRNK